MQLKKCGRVCSRRTVRSSRAGTVSVATVVGRRHGRDRGDCIERLESLAERQKSRIGHAANDSVLYCEHWHLQGEGLTWCFIGFMGAGSIKMHGTPWVGPNIS